MPGKFSLFCTMKSNIAIAPLRKNTVSESMVVKQFKLAFGFPARQGDSKEDMNLLRRAGFHTVYGLTNNINENDSLRCQWFGLLNLFIGARTIEQKKELFITHAQMYLERSLKSKASLPIGSLEPFQPIMDYFAQQFYLSVSPLLMENGQASGQKKARASEIREANIVSIGNYMTQLIFASIAIEKIIIKKEEISEATLQSVLELGDKILGAKFSFKYPCPMTKEQAIKKTLRLVAESSNDKRYEFSI